MLTPHGEDSPSLFRTGEKKVETMLLAKNRRCDKGGKKRKRGTRRAWPRAQEGEKKKKKDVIVLLNEKLQELG